MHSKYCTSSKDSALLIFGTLYLMIENSLIIRQTSSPIHAIIYGNRMHMQMECQILTSEKSAKLKQYYYFHAEFLVEVQYTTS